MQAKEFESVPAKAHKPKIPSFIPPMLAESVDTLPRGGHWGYEPKIDGHRVQVHKSGKVIEVRTRNNKRPAVNFNRITAQAKHVKADQAIIDGELAAVDDHGIPDFGALQNRDSGYEITFFAFDLLFLNGRALLSEPLSVRQALLREVIEDSGLRLCVTLPGKLAEIIQLLKRNGLEGVVAKDLRSTYRPNYRGLEWQKMRFNSEQEFVIGGYRAAGKSSVDALLVGVYEAGKLMFASKLAGGLTRWNRPELRRALQTRNTVQCPFANLPTAEKSRKKSDWISGGVSAEEMSEFQWVRPEVVAQIKFLEWTRQGLLRHPSFVGLRSDKAPVDVVRET